MEIPLAEVKPTKNDKVLRSLRFQSKRSTDETEMPSCQNNIDGESRRLEIMLQRGR